MGSSLNRCFFWLVAFILFIISIHVYDIITFCNPPQQYKKLFTIHINIYSGRISFFINKTKIQLKIHRKHNYSINAPIFDLNTSNWSFKWERFHWDFSVSSACFSTFYLLIVVFLPSRAYLTCDFQLWCHLVLWLGSDGRFPAVGGSETSVCRVVITENEKNH